MTLCAWNNYHDMCRWLLLHGGDPLLKQSTGDTSLHLASSQGHLDVVRLFFGKPVEDKKDNRDRRWIDSHQLITTVNTAGESAVVPAVRNGHVDVVRLLLAENAHVDTKAANGRSLLMIASEQGHENVCALLLHQKANIEFTHIGETPLTCAVWTGVTEVVQLLLYVNSALMILSDLTDLTLYVFGNSEKGANPNVRQSTGYTPFLLAARRGHVAICKLLAGIDDTEVVAIDDDGDTKSTGTGESKTKKLKITNRKAYIDKAGIQAHTRDGDTAMNLAMSGGHAPVVSLLLDQGIPLSLKAPGAIQKQFIVSATRGQLPMCQLLLDRCGATVNGRLRTGGDTALTICAYNNHVDTCKFLLKNKADAMISQGYCYDSSSSNVIDILPSSYPNC
jgi:ankyrin repeat protein